MSRLLRRGMAVLALSGATVFAGGSSVQAEPPHTETRHIKKFVEEFVDVIPTCSANGAEYQIRTVSNGVEHITESSKKIRAKFNLTGSFTATPVSGGQTASGRFTISGGWNENPGGAVNGTFTFSVRGTFADGTRIGFHAVDHFNVRPDGTEFFFSHCND